MNMALREGEMRSSKAQEAPGPGHQDCSRSGLPLGRIGTHPVSGVGGGDRAQGPEAPQPVDPGAEPTVPEVPLPEDPMPEPLGPEVPGGGTEVPEDPGPEL
jgi:hypothetical protein